MKFFTFISIFIDQKKSQNWRQTKNNFCWFSQIFSAHLRWNLEDVKITSIFILIFSNYTSSFIELFVFSQYFRTARYKENGKQRLSDHIQHKFFKDIIYLKFWIFNIFQLQYFHRNEDIFHRVTFEEFSVSQWWIIFL